MPIRVSGIQPGYLPWLGYFDQMMRVDAFIIADELAYSSSGWAHRNRVLGPSGVCWLTLPARPTAGQRIADVQLDRSVPWRSKHLRRLRHFYASGPETKAICEALEERLGPHPHALTDASIPTIQLIAELLDVRTPVLLSSELGLEHAYRQRYPDLPGPSHRIVAYMEALGARELLEGASGAAFIDAAVFERAGKRVTFHRYEHPTYPQLHGEAFTSHLSAIDLLLSVGPTRGAAVLRSGSVHE